MSGETSTVPCRHRDHDDQLTDCDERNREVTFRLELNGAASSDNSVQTCADVARVSASSATNVIVAEVTTTSVGTHT